MSFFAATIFSSYAQAQTPALAWGIPLKPDPPIAVDGRIDEWNKVPNSRLLNTREHSTFGGHLWKSPADLSAQLWLAWREEGLYIAAQVYDDKVVQKAHGLEMWKGDHLELYLDFAPESDAAQNGIGAGQLQIGLSPGNFQKTGDALADIAPEIVVYFPQGKTLGEDDGDKAARIAASKTEVGYDLEALLPWSLLARLSGQKFSGPPQGWPLGVEIAVSDSDAIEPTQEKILSLMTGTWERHRSLWQSAALAGTDGVIAQMPARKTTVFSEMEIAANEKKEVTFQAGSTPDGRRAVLVFPARIQFPSVAGYTTALGIFVNGVAIDGDQLLNRKTGESMNDGRAFTSFGAGRFYLPFADSFESADNDAAYGLRGSKASHFEIDVTDALREGENKLVFDYSAVIDNAKFMAKIGEGTLEFRAPVAPVIKRAAPTGVLPAYAPQSQHKVDYKISQPSDAELKLQIGKNEFQIDSQFSTPDGKWIQKSNAFFRHSRAIEKRDETIVVRDTFTNLSNENLPLMQKHSAKSLSGAWNNVWLSGLQPGSRVGSSNDPANPSSFATTENAGLGLLPLDDVFQVHINNWSDGESLGLSDVNLVLKAGATHVTEWLIVPTAAPKYYDFINAARRFRDVNFAIDGNFAFYFPHPNRKTVEWSDQQWKDFFFFKDAKYAAFSISHPRPNGLIPHGTAIFEVDLSYSQQAISRLKKLLPKQKFISYFHTFIDASPTAPTRFASERQLRLDGTQADYGNPGYKIFVPTENNAYGREMQRYVDLLLAPIPQGLGNEGIYWDEIEYSAARYHYDDFSNPQGGLPWDGVSADIDPQTKKIARLKSSVTLISQNFRVALAKSIMARGPLIGNGAPHTRKMMQQHFPRFTETGAISNCTLTHLYTPIALGDHITEKTEQDAYRVMVRALDYGCLYYWYGDDVVATHRTLASFMFPITPLELHEGYIIGKERIVTNRSGLFGWGDKSKHEVHVFDDSGREVLDFKAPTVVKDGKTFTELRLAEDWSAAIIRK